MKSCTGCLGRIVIRVLIVFAVIVVAVYSIRFAWYGTYSEPKQWTCNHLPTLCEKP